MSFTVVDLRLHGHRLEPGRPPRAGRCCWVPPPSSARSGPPALSIGALMRAKDAAERSTPRYRPSPIGRFGQVLDSAVAPRLHLSRAPAGAVRQGRTGSCCLAGLGAPIYFCLVLFLAARERSVDGKPVGRLTGEREPAAAGGARPLGEVDQPGARAAPPRDCPRRPLRPPPENRAATPSNQSGWCEPSDSARARSSGAVARLDLRTTESPADVNLSLLPLDLDRIGALIRRPGEKDAASAGGRSRRSSVAVSSSGHSWKRRVSSRAETPAAPCPPSAARNRARASRDRTGCRRRPCRIDAPVLRRP